MNRKVKLCYIANDSARKATFKKRKKKKGLLRKMSELSSTLCGIDVCDIAYRPYDNQLDVMEQSKKTANQDSFLIQRIMKSNYQLKKQRKNSREKEITELMFHTFVDRSMHPFGIMDLNDLGRTIEQYLKNIYKFQNGGRIIILTNRRSIIIQIRLYFLSIRKKGLLKKVDELSTLCAIVYNPYDNQHDVWSSHHGVKKIVYQFKRKPEMEQSKRMVIQNSFL